MTYKPSALTQSRRVAHATWKNNYTGPSLYKVQFHHFGMLAFISNSLPVQKLDTNINKPSCVVDPDSGQQHKLMALVPCPGHKLIITNYDLMMWKCEFAVEW